jgi:hypothetical protein
MIDPQIVEYIRKERAKGFSRQQIAGALLESGYEKVDIDDSLTQFPEEPTADRPPRNIYLIVAAIIAVIVGSFLIMYFSEGKNPEPVPGNETILLQELNSTQQAAALSRMVDGCMENWKGLAEPLCKALAKSDVKECAGDRDCANDYYTYQSRTGADLCVQISDGDARQKCTLYRGHEKSACGSLSGAMQSYCMAVMDGDADGCARIGNNDLESECRDSVALDKAISMKDALTCTGIEDTLQRDLCYAFVEKDIEQCNHRTQCEDEGYLTLHRMTNDGALCDKIRDPDVRDDCGKSIG